MKNHWLLASSISTVLGIITGSLYLLLAEHSVWFGDNSWRLSAFWSTFTLWAFVLLFFVALLFNLLAFCKLEARNGMLATRFISAGWFVVPDKQQQFLLDAESYLAQLGRQKINCRFSAEYRYLEAEQDMLVSIHAQTHCVDIADVRLMFQQMLSAELSAGMILSYAGFSKAALIFANEANIRVLDAKALRKVKRLSRQQQYALVHAAGR